MISSLYGSLLSFVFLALTTRVIKIRRSQKISIGDQGNQILQRAVRAQSNFCESVPIFMILLIIAELNMVNYIILHFCGLIILFGRVFHAFGISHEKAQFHFRASGMLLTLISITILALANLVSYFSLILT